MLFVLAFTALIVLGAMSVRFIDKAADIAEAEKVRAECFGRVEAANRVISMCRSCEGSPVNITEVLEWT